MNIIVLWETHHWDGKTDGICIYDGRVCMYLADDDWFEADVRTYGIYPLSRNAIVYESNIQHGDDPLTDAELAQYREHVNFIRAGEPFAKCTENDLRA